MKKYLKLLAIFFISVFISFLPITAASAADLTWESGTTQQIEIENALASNLVSIVMESGGRSLVFKEKSIGTTRAIYEAQIPDDFANKNFSIIAKFKDGSNVLISSAKVVVPSNFYNPITDFAGVTAASITLFALFTTWNNNDAPSARRRDEDTYGDERAELSGVDKNTVGKDYLATKSMRRSFFSSFALDEFRNLSTISLSKYSPMFSRLISDGGYLQYFIGSLSLIFPALGVVLGVMAQRDIVGFGYITTPSLSISLALIILGCIDAGAAFIGSVVFGFLCYQSNLLATAFDVRTYLGLSLLWFTPALMANATRALRKSRRDVGNWDRLADFIIGPLLTGWAIKGIINGLNGLAHLTLPLSHYADLCGAVAALVLLVRYSLEEFASYKHEGYLAFVSPTYLHDQSSNFRLLSWFARGFLFLFLSISFFGIGWQLWVALALFVAPWLVGAIKQKLPNSPILYQLIPVGIPSIIFMSLLGHSYSALIDNLQIPVEDKSKNMFLIMAISGFILMILKSFGRKPKKGDVRWYMRDQFSYLYKLLGPLFLVIALGLTVGVIG